MKPSHAYVRRRFNPLAELAAFFGWLLFQLLLLGRALLVRARHDFAGASWQDIVGSLLFLPVAVVVFVALAGGRTALLQLLAIWGMR